MAQITGLAHSRMAWNDSRVRRECAGIAPGSASPARPFRSAPAQNTRPAPVSTMDRMAGVSLSVSKTWVNSWHNARL